jgi:hypothetical protein
MQAAAQQLAESIVSATAVLHNPASTQQQRAEAVAFFEQLKHGEVHATAYAAAVLTGTQYALEVQVSAYSLLQHLVRHRWDELSAGERSEVTQLAYQHTRDGAPRGFVFAVAVFCSVQFGAPFCIRSAAHQTPLQNTTHPKKTKQ